ncbi:MAG: tail fiber protein [Hormoscilla sp. GUM202]|nr:tail fiber protein [Hormoscilla sp. GUM202]
MNRKRILGAAIAILLAVTLIFGTQVNSARASEVPIGTIMAYGGETKGSAASTLQNQGWLVCDGQEFTIADYEKLYLTIGTYYGTASTPGKFKVPDLRGRFVRGVDYGTGRDPDAASRTASAAGGNKGDLVGSYQDDEFKSHHHFVMQSDDRADNSSTARTGAGQDSNDPTPATSDAGGNETRPKNIYVNWIIKAKDVS